MQKELEAVIHQEELTWHQRSRAKWLQDGDRNTRYYHVKATKRKRRNRIHMLRNNDGIWIEDEKQLKSLVIDFFKRLFCGEGAREVHQAMRYGFKRIDSTTIASLEQELSVEEIKGALFQMDP